VLQFCRGKRCAKKHASHSQTDEREIVKLILRIKRRNKNVIKNPKLILAYSLITTVLRPFGLVADMKFGKWLLVVIKFFLHGIEILNFFFFF
jgi:hypothetical protein